MFSFLNRNKSAAAHNGDKSLPDGKDGQKGGSAADHTNGTFSTQDEIEDAKKNLYDSIVLKRTDILVSIMNEWFKSEFEKESYESSLYRKLSVIVPVQKKIISIKIGFYLVPFFASHHIYAMA
jgi:hypothetical protein